jgi:magnesium-transporting ATPase (P-type)
MGKDKEVQQKLANHKSGQSNEPMSAPAHSLTFNDVCQQLQSSAVDGLTPEDAKKRLEQYGKNELDNGPGVNPVRILVRQVANAMMLVSRTRHFCLCVDVLTHVLLRCFSWPWASLLGSALTLKVVS